MGIEAGILAIAAIATPVVVNVLIRIKTATQSHDEKLGDIEVHLAEINGAVSKNSSDLVVHATEDDRRDERRDREDDKRDERRDREYVRTQEILDQIWAKISVSV